MQLSYSVMADPAAQVDRAQVEALVHQFYASVRADALLAPVFARAMHRSWPAHLALMSNFWCTVLRVERSFNGDVYAPHARLDGIGAAHLVRWLGLWRQHARAALPPEPAQKVVDVALGMGRVLHQRWAGTLPSRAELVIQLDAAMRIADHA